MSICRKAVATALATLLLSSVFSLTFGSQPASAGWWEDNFEVHGFLTSKAYFRTPGFRERPELTSWRTELNLEWEARLYDNMDTRVAVYGVVRPIYEAIYDIQDDCFGDDIDQDFFDTFGVGAANAEASGRGDDVMLAAGGTGSAGCQIEGELTTVAADTGSLFGFGPTAAVFIDNKVFFGGVPATWEAVGPNQGKSGGNATIETYQGFAGATLDGRVQGIGTLNPGAGLVLASLGMAGEEGGIGAAIADGDPVAINNSWAPLNFGFGGGISDRGSYEHAPVDINRRQSNLQFECGDNAHPWCFVRELYIEFEHKETFVRLGKQQIVWGKTDAFRLQDRINPLDFGYHSIWADLEERRIPQLALDVIHSFGNVGMFQDVSLEFVWVFDRFLPVQVGQCGEPYAFTGACEARADAGGHQLFNVSFAGVTDDVQHWKFSNTEPGVRLEFRIPKPSIAFSLSAFWTHQDIPVLKAQNHYSTDNPNSAMFLFLQGLGFGGIPGLGALGVAFDPFARNAPVEGVRANGEVATISRPLAGSSLETMNNTYLGQFQAVAAAACGGLAPSAVGACFTANSLDLAALPWTASEFTLEYPRVLTIGGSIDYQIPGIDTILRFELSYDFDRQFSDSSEQDYQSESDFFQLSIGLDRSTFIPFLNRNRTAFLSFQTFIAHITDYEDGSGHDNGMIDYETNVISTFFMENYWRNDTIILTTVAAVDWNAGAWTIFPRLRYVLNENWFFDIGVNLIWGNRRSHDIANLCPDGTLGNPGADGLLGTGDDGAGCNIFDPSTWQAGTWQNWVENFQRSARSPFFGQESFADKFYQARDEVWFGFTYQW